MWDQEGDARADRDDERAGGGVEAAANAGAAAAAAAEPAADAALPASEPRQTDAHGTAVPAASRRRRGEPAHCQARHSLILLHPIRRPSPPHTPRAALSARRIAQVPSCGTVLHPDVAGRRYSFRYRVCEPCMRADHCILGAAGAGTPQRFCQARA